MPIDDLISAAEILDPLHFNRAVTRTSSKDDLLCVLFEATGLTPDKPVEHRVKLVQWQLFAMEHARRGFPLRGKSVADCVASARSAFGETVLDVPFSMHYTPDRTAQYVIIQGATQMLPASTTGKAFDSFTAPDGRIYISDGQASFYVSDLLQQLQAALVRRSFCGCESKQ